MVLELQVSDLSDTDLHVAKEKRSEKEPEGKKRRFSVHAYVDFCTARPARLDVGLAGTKPTLTDY